MYLRIVLIIASIALVLGCTSGGQTKPTWETAAGVDIPAFKTFGWVDELTGSPNTILESRITDALRTGLTGKGYVEATDSPEVLIGYEVMEREVTKQGSPIRLGVGLGSYGGNVGGSVGSSVDVGGKEGVLQLNQIRVRALEPDDRKEIWIGSSSTFEPQPDAALVSKVVADVLKGFPAKRP